MVIIMDMLQQNKYVYDLVNKWIENADNKVNVSFAVFTGVFSAITFLTGNAEKAAKINECLVCLYRACTVLSMFFLFLSILFYFIAINPDLGSTDKEKDAVPKDEKGCPIYFGDIALLSREDYKNRMSNANEKNFIDELQNEIHYNSWICKRKMKMYKKGLWLSFAAVAFTILRWVIMYCML